MDLLTPPGRTAAATLRRVAAEAGIRETDPLGPVIEALASTTETVADLPDTCTDRFAGLDTRLSELLAKAETQAGGQLARAAAAELPRAVDRLALASFKWWLVAAVAVLVTVSSISWGVGYWMRDLEVVQIQQGLGVALRAKDAGAWLDLMRMNQGNLTCGELVTEKNGGIACNYLLWTKLPATPPPTVSK